MKSQDGNTRSDRKTSTNSSSRRFTAIALIALACVVPIAIQRFLSISPEVIGTIGIPTIMILGFLGSVTVIAPVPVLSLVFAGAAILNPIALVIAAAVGITAGMAVCYVMGKRGHSRAASAAAISQENLPKQIAYLYSWSTKNVGTASFILAAMPNPVFDYAGFIAGAGRFNAQRFLAGTFAGKITQASVIVIVGHTVGERITAYL
ncbi:MAG: VTT domain-containing protein [Chloroflexi bacterium]|nr:VTT domain-containing protein [Chloroflexota bacterium]